MKSNLFACRLKREKPSTVAVVLRNGPEAANFDSRVTRSGRFCTARRRFSNFGNGLVVKKFFEKHAGICSTPFLVKYETIQLFGSRKSVFPRPNRWFDGTAFNSTRQWWRFANVCANATCIFQSWFDGVKVVCGFVSYVYVYVCTVLVFAKSIHFSFEFFSNTISFH